MSCAIIDDCLIAGIEASIQSLLVDRFTVQSFTMVADGSGGQAQTWANETTNVPGFMEGSKEWSREPVAGIHQQEVRRWTITLQRGTVVDGSDRIVQTHKNGVAITPRTFQIISVIAEGTLNFAVDIEAVELPNLS